MLLEYATSNVSAVDPTVNVGLEVDESLVNSIVWNVPQKEMKGNWQNTLQERLVLTLIQLFKVVSFASEQTRVVDKTHGSVC